MLLRLLPASSLPCGAGEAQGAAAKPSPSRLGGSPCAPPGAGSSAWSCWCHPGPSCRAGFGVFPPGCRAGGCELCFFGCARLRGGFLGGRGVPQQSFGPSPSPARLSCSCFPREAPGKTWDTSSTPGAAPAPCGAPFFLWLLRSRAGGTQTHTTPCRSQASPRTPRLRGRLAEGPCCSPPLFPGSKSKALFSRSPGCRPAVRQPDGKARGALLPSPLAPSPDLAPGPPLELCQALGAALGLLHNGVGSS